MITGLNQTPNAAAVSSFSLIDCIRNYELDEMGIFGRKPDIEKPKEEIDVDGLIKVLRDIDKGAAKIHRISGGLWSDGR